MREQDFQPDWVSAPGETISDLLSARRISESDFAKRLGCSLSDVRNLLQGRATITLSLARRLEKVLGASVEFWMSRDFRFRRSSVRAAETDSSWLKELPLGDMIKFGWLNPVPRPSEELEACLRFFGVTSVEAWHRKYAALDDF